MSADASHVSTTPRALAWATDVDTLPPDAVVERRGGYLLIRSPSNPIFYCRFV